MSSTLPSPAWDDALGELLHFTQVLESVGSFCVTGVARERINTIRPVTDLQQLSQRYTATAELLMLLERDSPPPLGSSPDIRPALQRLKLGASILTPEEFHQVRLVLQVLEPLHTFFRDQADLSYWSQRTNHFNPWSRGIAEINRIIEENLPDGTASQTVSAVKSTASRELQRLRAAISKLELQIRRRLDELHTQARQSGWAQDEPIAWREGRLVIALKSSYKRKLRGLIHGHSSSGATAFVEPLEVFDMNNELATLRDDEKTEELRLLSALTNTLRPFADNLALSAETLYHLDVHLAQARWAHKLEAVQPDLIPDGPLDLAGARNPVLAEHREVVPLDIRLDETERIIIISGPNAGGKTVVLLTVGLAVMLAQSGLFIPAKRATLPLFQALYTDLGDRQSLEQDLSTFSAHLSNLKGILSRCDHSTLVLLDELGTGTEPEAGAALGQTFLESIRDRQAYCLASTHLNRLKLWAQDEPGILNAGMAFDDRELRPTYRLEIGHPGASFALEIAQRLGLDEHLLQRAQALMPQAAVSLENLLVSLEADRADVQRLNSELSSRLTELEAREQQVSAREAELQAAHRRARKDALGDAEQMLSDMNRRLEAVIAEIRSKGASLTRDDIRSAKRTIAREMQRIADERSRLTEEEPDQLSMDDLQPGMWVTLKEQGRLARVEKRYPGRSRVTVNVEGMRLTLPVDQLVRGHEPQPERIESPPIKTAGVKVEIQGPASYRLDLRGQRGDEAVAAVDRFLNRAILAGLSEVEIIHGKGTGALQERVQEFLQEHPQVKSFRFADFDAGGTGVTLVELR